MGVGVCLLMCWLNSTSVYCVASTETQIEGKKQCKYEYTKTKHHRTKTIWPEKAI